MFTSGKYDVLVSEYAKKHFMKSYIKKYKTWDDTYKEIYNMLSHIDRFLLSTKAEKIHIGDNGYIAKCEFKIVGSHESAKTSGNRIIVFVDEERFESSILLIYAKTDVAGSNETVWWEQEVKNNHKEIYDLFGY
ncbi:MAG: hypothetical protein PHI37_03810 [Candidatus Gracilibacteria bacterium]|nr:hypothetical protein [Candidatus Gracilibacteria bacterium]